MVSTKSIEMFIKTARVGSYLKLFPVNWNRTTSQLEPVDVKFMLKVPFVPFSFITLDLGRVMPIVYIVHQSFHIIYLILFLLLEEYSKLDMCFALFFSVSLWMPLCGQIVCFLHSKSFCAVVNAVLELDMALIMLTKRSRNDPDNAELVIQLCIGCAVAITLAVTPLGFYPWYYEDLHVYQHFIRSFQTVSPIYVPRIIGTIGLLLNLTFSGVICFTSTILVVIPMVTYATSQTASMQHLRKLWRANTECREMKKLIGLKYRMCQLMHEWTMEEFKILIPVFLVTAELIIIFGLFGTIRFINTSLQIFSIFILGVGLVCFTVLRVSLEFSSRMRSSSAAFSRTPKAVNTGISFSHDREDELFLKSCRPLVLRVASTFVITEETFLTISKDIIVNSLINLLVATK